MKFKFKKQIVVYMLSIFFGICIGKCVAEEHSESQEAQEKSVKNFIQHWDQEATQYFIRFYDLNQDGIMEAIVYVTGGKWCGSGGCVTLVLNRKGDNWNLITKISVSNLPIKVLPVVHNGWHSLSVSVKGGGVLKRYESELPYDGKVYPNNPTVPPAVKIGNGIGQGVDLITLDLIQEEINKKNMGTE